MAIATSGSVIKLLPIPGGSFMMGSPGNESGRLSSEVPQRLVTVSPFLLGQHPVTQAQWRFVAGLPKIKRKLDPDPSSFKGNSLPVDHVSWHDAVEFCARLSIYESRHYRLPTEAEWEYACRAGTTTPFYFGETIALDLVNFCPKRNTRTSRAGRFPPNTFGLYDMHGNLWEWCQDGWHHDYEGAPTDGSAWLSDGNPKAQVLRGGSWNSLADDCRSASRGWVGSQYSDNIVGFRVVCSGPIT